MHTTATLCAMFAEVGTRPCTSTHKIGSDVSTLSACPRPCMQMHLSVSLTSLQTYGMLLECSKRSSTSELISRRPLKPCCNGSSAWPDLAEPCAFCLAFVSRTERDATGPGVLSAHVACKLLLVAAAGLQAAAGRAKLLAVGLRLGNDQGAWGRRLLIVLLG